MWRYDGPMPVLVLVVVVVLLLLLLLLAVPLQLVRGKKTVSAPLHASTRPPVPRRRQRFEVPTLVL